jgi:hypothetical protein
MRASCSDEQGNKIHLEDIQARVDKSAEAAIAGLAAFIAYRASQPSPIKDLPPRSFSHLQLCVRISQTDVEIEAIEKRACGINP